jgi:hypothetical protein
MATRKCPRCEADVELESKVCHACGLVFSSSEPQTSSPAASVLPPPPENLANRNKKRREKMSPNKTYATSRSGSGGFGTFLLGLIIGIALLLVIQKFVTPIIEAGKAKSQPTSRLESQGGVITKAETPTDTTIADTTKIPDVSKEAIPVAKEIAKTTTAPLAGSSEYYTTGDSYSDRLVNNFRREPSFIDNVEALYDHYMQSGEYSAAARVCRDALATGAYVGEYRARIENWLSEAESRY